MKKYFKIPFIMILGFLFAQCSFLKGMYPLGISVLCVACLSKNFYFLFIGSVLGTLTISTGFNMLVNSLPYAIALPFFMLLRKYREDSVIYKFLIAISSFLLPAFLLKIQLYLKVALVFSGIFSSCLIPLVKRLYIFYRQINNRLSLEQPDIIAICVLGGIMVSSLPEFNFYGFNLTVFALLATSSVALTAFSVRGSIWATVCGIIYILKGGDLTIALCLITGGLLAGIFSTKKGGVILGFVLGDVIISLFTLNTLVLSLNVVNIILSCGYTVFLKEKFVERIRRFAGIESGVNDLEMAYIEGLKDKQKTVIENSARMYLQLSKAFKEASVDDEFKENILKDAKKVCENCKKKEYCLKNRQSDTLIELKEAVKKFEYSDTVTSLPLTLTARCIQPISLICAMNDAYKKYRIYKDENPSQEEELASQLKSLSDMLFALADEVSCLPQFDKEMENQVRDVLESRLGTVKRVSCRKKGESHILNLSVKENNKNTKEKIIKSLEEGFLGRYQCLKGITDIQGGFSGSFAPLPRFDVDAVILREKKKGQNVCGDSFTFFDVENDKYVAAISDGAGSGEKAKRESESTLDLLETFSEANVSRSEMFKTMNRLMLIKGEKEDYSTVDVTEFDLQSGIMYWTKIGAVPGYILRNGKVEKVETGGLPMGIVTGINPVTTKKIVLEDDVIVLVSDGVYDGLNVGNEDKISDILKANFKESPKIMAQNILSAAKSTAVNDDMTVMVLKVKVA